LLVATLDVASREQSLLALPNVQRKGRHPTGAVRLQRMQSKEIRSRFLAFFERNGHKVLPSASLVPQDDPTLLFTNAGMVPFKKMFLGLEEPVEGRRAATSQKCVRAGGKHNDLEQVGHTARHHTFFEMLGNFSFGDYFKRDAIKFAWEFLTGDLKLDPAHLRVTVYRDDEEARALWKEVAQLKPSRIYGLGDKDNFWQMADTGPCGPCSEIYADLAHLTDDWSVPKGSTGEWTQRDRSDFSEKAFVAGAEAGRFLEIWNLVFMQFDRQQDGKLNPLPKPSVDTGMGLERTAAVLQRQSNDFHTDLFLPLLEVVAAAANVRYDRASSDEKYASHRVIADHARAVAFLLADGVFPSNEGRGYVLRRILRRAVRHAWLLGRNEPLLHTVVGSVISQMSDAYPELERRARHIVDTTRAEEERFLTTIEGGMRRFDEIAPPATTQGSTAIRGTISGEDAFKLYDTYGFPLDLTELMARERGYTVDVAGFEQALAGQRTQSQEERRAKKLGVGTSAALLDEWETPAPPQTGPGATEKPRVKLTDLPGVKFVGYDSVDTETEVLARHDLENERIALILRETPFYAESGGQISDAGEVLGEGWRLDVDEVRRVDGKIAVIGMLEGELRFGPARARVPRDRRLDTERNHTATHLLHAALREVLGEHVHQAGSLVAPDRLRFDFTHHGPLTREQLSQVEEMVNRGIFAAEPVRFEEKRYADAMAMGAMALFGEKYGEMVRVVSIPGRSIELCGGTHVRNTAEIGLFRIVNETGVAAGVRRIEALTGPAAFEWMRDIERELARIEELVGASPGGAAQKVESLVSERGAARHLSELMHAELMRTLIRDATSVDGVRLVTATVEVPDVRTLQLMGDVFRGEAQSGVAVLAAHLGTGKSTVLIAVTDDLSQRGVRADTLVREITSSVGGRGGGKAHMAQAGVPDPSLIPDMLARVPELLSPHLRGPGPRS